MIIRHWGRTHSGGALKRKKEKKRKKKHTHVNEMIVKDILV